jgi:hypothetical protein
VQAQEQAQRAQQAEGRAAAPKRTSSLTHCAAALFCHAGHNKPAKNKPNKPNKQKGEKKRKAPKRTSSLTHCSALQLCLSCSHNRAVPNKNIGATLHTSCLSRSSALLLVSLCRPQQARHEQAQQAQQAEGREEAQGPQAHQQSDSLLCSAALLSCSHNMPNKNMGATLHTSCLTRCSSLLLVSLCRPQQARQEQAQQAQQAEGREEAQGPQAQGAQGEEQGAQAEGEEAEGAEGQASQDQEGQAPEEQEPQAREQARADH